MALFEKMKDSISIAGQGVSQKAKSATESVRIGNLIKANDRMIDKLTHQVGIQCVNKYINDPHSEFAELFSEILRLRDENRKLQLELQQATAVNTCPHCGFGNNMAAKFCISCGAPLSAAPAPATGGRSCPKCGFANTADAAFCVECGTPMPPAAPAQTAIPTPPVPPAPPIGGRSCPKCGFVNAEDVSFCVECGTPMPPITPPQTTVPTPPVPPAPAAIPTPTSDIEPEPIQVSLAKPDDTAVPGTEPIGVSLTKPVSDTEESSQAPSSEETVPAPEVIAEPVIPETPQVSLCKNCGAVLDDDSLFCTECGTKRD